MEKNTNLLDCLNNRTFDLHFIIYFMTFSSLGLSESILKAVTEQQYTEPYPIQTRAIPAILEGQSVLGIAQTGSGKTASFVLPI